MSADNSWIDYYARGRCFDLMSAKEGLMSYNMCILRQSRRSWYPWYPIVRTYTACTSVRYCGVTCQRNHRRAQESMQEGAAELRDEILFKQPLKATADCPICLLPFHLININVLSMNAAANSSAEAAHWLIPSAEWESGLVILVLFVVPTS